MVNAPRPEWRFWNSIRSIPDNGKYSGKTGVRWECFQASNKENGLRKTPGREAGWKGRQSQRRAIGIGRRNFEIKKGAKGGKSGTNIKHS